MKHKRLLSMLVLLAAIATGAWAQPWTSGDCTVNLSDGELTVSKTSGDGNGAMANTTQRQRPWYNYLKSITSVVVEEGVTYIGTSAFLNCTNLESATIPASVTSIGNQAFQTCTGMTSVIIADGSSLTNIGSSAFYGCINLGSITLPASVTSIGQRAFNMCNNLATVTLNSNPFIGSEAFDGIKDGAVVTMNLTATSADDAKWTTFYNEAYGFQADANTEVFKVALSGTALTLNKVDNGIVDAGTAVVLKTTSGNPVMTLTTSASSDTQDNSLTGVSAAAGATSDGTFYVLNNGASGIGFYRLASGGKVPVGNAYLTSDSESDFFSIGGGSGSEEASTYTVSLKEGTEDADKWTIDPVDAKEGDEIKATYTGKLKVKSVKAVKKADNAYLKWDADQNKLVATEIPAEVTKVENSNENVEWAGTYVVEGDVTISGEIKLTGDVELIIKDGAKLTVTTLIHTTSGASLSVYGQTQMSGELNVTNSGSDAIMRITTLEVHSCKVKATSPAGDGGGVYLITTLNVYGGSLDAENTGEGSGHGIILKKGGALNIYGGEVKAVGKGNHADYSYGIKSSSTKDVANIKVYGGKLWAECADNKAFRQINLTTEAGFNGKIETSGNGDEWTPWESGTPETKYVRVGY